MAETTGYQCRVERDSISPDGKRLTSFVIRFPRIVLAEAVTHRMVSDAWGDIDLSLCERNTTPDVSKNSASSRAIPLARMIQAVMDDPYIPERFTGAGPGMQGKWHLEGADHATAVTQWLHARDDAVTRACLLLSRDDRSNLCATLTGAAADLVRIQVGSRHGPTVSVHKQDVNRLLEPFAWITQIVTATEWDNYFALRCHHAAHPALRRIARLMFLARRRSTPDKLVYGQWHLPDPIKFSAARCAWISYENHDKDGSPEQMLRTFDRLLAETPKHASPVEHQATPKKTGQIAAWLFQSNLQGWIQARKLVPMERVDRYEPTEDEIASWGISE